MLDPRCTLIVAPLTRGQGQMPSAQGENLTGVEGNLVQKVSSLPPSYQPGPIALVRDKPTAFGRATLEGSADPARKKYALPPGKPVGAGGRAYARFAEFSACQMGLQVPCGLHPEIPAQGALR